MTDRKLGLPAAALVAASGILLLAVAAWTDGYWQALLINIGTGVLLFVALEQIAIYRLAEALTGMLAGALPFQSDERIVEMWSRARSFPVEARRSLARELQATSPLAVEQFEDLARQLDSVEHMAGSKQLKTMSYFVLLSDHYGVERVRQMLLKGPGPGAAVPGTTPAS